MNKLIWFNSQGDALNIVPDVNTGIYTGTLNFDENSSDTFKTIGLYLFESIDPITFDSISGDTQLQKFQLFNQNRFTFTGNSFFTQSVTDIQAVNNHSDFYSKWIYGDNFETMFPVGSSIIFNTPIFEFTSPITTYTVVATQKGSIMILSGLDNRTFTNLYGGLTFSNVTISGINSIGIYDYKRGYIDQLSSWNEPQFYTKLYNNKKLNIINPGGTYSNYIATIKNTNLLDKTYFKYSIDSFGYTQSKDLSVILTLKTDLPNVYRGGLSLTANSIYFSNTIPQVLKPGTDFVINNSSLNPYILTVAPISTFVGNVNSIYYATQSQVIWNNLIYQCIQSYYYTATSSINPDNGNYWTSSITYLPVNNTLNTEVLLDATIHLTTNVLYFTQTFTNSNDVTMALFAQNNSNIFNSFNINLNYSNGILSSDLLYSSQYAIVDYKIGTQSITNTLKVSEKTIQTEEVLYNQINTNVNNNFRYEMVISKIDDFGIKYTINGQVYTESVEYIYNGLNVDERRTIDRTLRNFLYNNIARLTSIGILVTLESSIYTPEFDFFKDTIIFTTQYPNVSMKIAVQMGTLASYYIKHSKVEFYDCGNYLNLTINNKSYGISVTSTTSSIFIPDLPTTITNWVNKYSATLYGYGILVSNIRNILYFDLSEPTTTLKYSIRTSKLATPGIDQYVITNYIPGNFATLIAGNQVVLAATSSQNFEVSGFATGMITAVNNTVYPYDNQEYNIIHLDSNQLGLSYQGPFWDTYGVECDLSAYTTLAFSPLAYGVTSCPPITSGSSSGSQSGEFSVIEFNSGFSITYYTAIAYSDISYTSLGTSNTNTADMLYVNVFGKIYVAGDNLSVVDATSFTLDTVITLPYTGTTKIVYNSYNKYLYLIAGTRVIVVDPTTNVVYKTINVGLSITDILICQNNGDVYLSVNSSNVYIYKYNSFVSYDNNIVITNAGKMEYDFLNNYVYIVGDQVYSINTATKTIVSTIPITSLDNRYIYTEPIYGSMYVWGDYLYHISEGGMTTSLPLTNTTGANKLIYDNFSGDLFLTQANLDFSRITYLDNVVYTLSGDTGDIVISQYDGAVYMVTTTGNIVILSPGTGNVIYTHPVGFVATRVIFDPLRESVIMMGSSGQLKEIKTTLYSTISISPTQSTPSTISDGLFGTLDPNYVPRTDLWLKTRQYLRGPRANYTGDDQAQIIYKFVDDTVPQIFMYDISGNQLSTGTSYSYIGPKPLPVAYLNRDPNQDITKVSDSSVQQTIFDEIKNTLDYIDSETDISILPTPIELFLGYNDINEGYVSSTLKMYYRENVSLTINPNPLYNNNITLMDLGTSSTYPDGYGMIQLDVQSVDSFLYDSNDNKTGLKAGQIIQLVIYDIINLNNKYISYNNGQEFEIIQINSNQILVKYIENSHGGLSYITDETTYVLNYPSTGYTTYLQFEITVLDKEIATIDLYGQTEIEDVRYKTELYNSGGHNINPQDAYIFKTYDIDEQGIDWSFLNKKRKEMLIVRSEIFPYVGSYKAIINAINYFGYNDLLLYEYYRNIDINSPNFYKLFKVEIPNIFDNTVAGFTIDDFLKNTMPNPYFEETNLFNLTYLITDKQGNNVLLYSLQEVIIKLQGLKKWLETNVIPITNKILDITGRTDIRGGTYIRHKSFQRIGLGTSQYHTPIDFNINEAYLMPVNSGSTIYNVRVDFVTPKNVTLPEDFTVKIRTYKTYLEWNPFTIYNKGDEVIYYGIIYQSAIDTNKLLDPRKYQDVAAWNSTIEYFDGQIVNYNRHIYEYLGTQSSYIVFGTSSAPTPAQVINSGTFSIWLDISEWIVQDLVPVQSIYEYRKIDMITYSNTTTNILFYTSSVAEPDYLKVSNPFNFSVDSNIDPFITVEVTSDNGYGLVYTTKKNYEIRGTNDLFVGEKNIEPIGPFIPITPVTTHI